MITSSERARGLAVRCKMDSRKSINDAGFTIVGTPSFSNNGMVFNGTTNYLTSNPKTFESNNFRSVGFSVRWKAKVAEADLNGTLLTVLDTSSGDPPTNDGFYIIYDDRGGAAPVNGIRKDIATVTSTNRQLNASSVLTYDAFEEWCAVYDGATITLYKNGVISSTNNSGSGTGNYTPSSAVSTIGAFVGGGSKFKGTMLFLETWANALTAQEVLDLYNNAAHTYRNKAILSLTMDMNSYDFTNKLVLDRSGKGNNFTLGDGSAASTFPTKLATKGFSFDGGDYLKRIHALVSTTYTVFFLIRKSSAATGYLIDCTKTAGTGNIYFDASNLLTVTSGSIYIDGISVASYTGELINKVICVQGITLSSSEIQIGSNNAYGTNFNGDIKDFKVFSGSLTPLQILDMSLNLKQEINKV